MPETPPGRGDLQRAARIGGGDHIRRQGGQVAGFAIAEVARPAPAAPGCRCRRCRSRSRLRPATPARRRESPAAARAARRARPGRARDGRRRDTPRGRGSGAAARAARPSSASTSDTSRTLALNAWARAAQAGSSANSSPYSFIADPQPAALTTMRSAPGLLEHLDGVPGQRARLVDVAGVQRQRAAAALRRGRRHPAAFGREHAHGGLVHVPEREALHAAGQHRHLQALLALRRACPPAVLANSPASVTGGATPATSAAAPAAPGGVRRRRVGAEHGAHAGRP